MTCKIARSQISSEWESSQRLFLFEIVDLNLPVVRLEVNLQDNHAVYFAEGQLLQFRNAARMINLLEKEAAD